MSGKLKIANDSRLTDVEPLYAANLDPMELKALAEERLDTSETWSELMDRIGEESIRNGTDTMTMEEIDAEIALYRKEKAEANLASKRSA